MAKNRRIKTYKKIYQEPGGPFSSPIGVVMVALGFVVIAIIGWSAYGPVYNFVMGIGEKGPDVSSSRPPTSQSTPGDTTADPTQSLPGDTPADNPASEPTPAELESVRVAYMPAQFASDLNRVDAFLGALPADSYDTVMVDLKDASGRIYYKTEVVLANEAEAVVAQGVGASAIAARIREAGYRPAARIHAFSDHLMSAYERDAAISYMNTDWTWLDNSPELGGKPWLNPYSDIAQSYITDIATELARAGFELILVDSLHFPTGVGTEKAGYGEAGQQTPRLAQLSRVATRLSTAVEQAGGHCALYIPASSIVALPELVYGGNPLDIYGGTIVVGMMPGTILPGSSIGGVTLTDPIGDPAHTITTLFTLIPKDAHTRTIAWLQGYTVSGTPAEPAFISAQIRGIPREGRGYVVYNPQGAYRK